MLVKIVSSKRKKKRREHKSGLSLSPSLRDKMCGSLNGVLCALHLMSSLFFFCSFSFLCPSSIYGSAFTLTGAVKVSCTWSSPSVKMASTCWDRTARPLTPSQSSSTFTPHTNSRSEALSTCPCYSQCWCRHSDRPGAPFQWSDTSNMNVWLDLPSGVKAFSSILTGRLLMIQHEELILPTTAVYPCQAETSWGLIHVKCSTWTWGTFSLSSKRGWLKDKKNVHFIAFLSSGCLQNSEEEKVCILNVPKTSRRLRLNYCCSTLTPHRHW